MSDLKKWLASQPAQPVDQEIPQSTVASNDNGGIKQWLAEQTPAPAVKTETTFDKLQSAMKEIESVAYASGKGIAQGVSDVLSTVDKAVIKGLGYVPGLKEKLPAVEDIQSGYEVYTDKYNKDADTNAHPWASGIGRVAGNIAATAPLSALTGGGAAAASTAAKAGLGTVGQGVARVAGEAGVGALQGAAQGALMNTPGQGTDIINQKGLEQGALFGGTVGAVGSAVLGNYGKNLQNYQDYSKTLGKAGYKGPVFSTDIPGNQGVYNSVKESVVNGVISKIPLINNIPGIGTQSARDAQASGIQQALKSMASQFGDANPTTTQLQFSNAIKRAKAAGDEAIANTSNNFRQILTNQKINNHPLTLSKPIADDLLSSNKSILSQNAKTALSNMADVMNTDTILGTAKQAGLKQRIWNEYERLATDRANTPAYDAAVKLRDLYHSINDDLLNSVGHDSKAAEAFQRFNTVTTAVKTLWDPKNSPALSKAFKDINGDANGMMTFFNKLQKGTLSPQAQEKYSQVLGTEGTEAVSKDLLHKIFTSNIDSSTGKFNISGLLQQVEKAPSNLIPKDMKESLNGLQWLAQKVGTSEESNKSIANTITNNIGIGALAGGAAYVSNTAKAILGTGAALGTITAHAPLKNALIYLNKAMGNTADGNLSQYLIDRASKYLTRAGVSIITHKDGTIEIQKKEPEEKKNPRQANGSLGVMN